MLLSTGVPCLAQEAKTYYQSAGTKEMAELLQKIYREQDVNTDPTKDGERATALRIELAGATSLGPELKLRYSLAEALLRSGDSAGAIQELERVRSECAKNYLRLDPYSEQHMRDTLALSYLRLGEQQNCSLHHNEHSCIFPLESTGIHRDKTGAQGAARELTASLKADPNNAQSRWLLNLAYMQMGEYPGGVPAQWVVSPQLFDSEYDVGRFPDVAPRLGLSVTGHAGGVVMEDFDGDGLLDLMISSSGPMDQLRFFHNNGDGTFTERTREAGLTGETGGLNLVAADYDNDGHMDLLVLRGGWWGEHGKYPMSLLHNNGDGTFDDVTRKAGLLSLHPTQTAAWADYDNDGWLDLFVGHETNGPEKHPSQLFHNNHDGTFTEVGTANGVADLGFVKGVAWGDFNNDGRPDLYISRLGQPNLLFRNDGPRDAKKPRADHWKFTDVTATAHVAEQRHSFATWFFDYDNDGWPDLFVSGYYNETQNDIGAFQMGLPYKAETPRLYHNNHDGTFTDVTQQVHLDRVILAMGAGFGDLDNDGWLDIYIGTGASDLDALLPNRMFRNDEGKRFQDVTTSGGFGHLQKGHSVAFGDINNDGQEDIFEEIGGALPGDSYQSVLFANPGHDNHWLSLDLEGVTTNRSAFGARIAVTLKTPEGDRHIYRTVGYGSSFGGNPLRQHIGVGKNTTIEEVEIAWPTSGTVQRFHDLPADHAYFIREGVNTLVPRNFKSFSLTEPQTVDTQR
ncbi:MAG: FG-GAP-like repeat-containing protein [Candidatus Korobacteraceae bacterium]